MARGRGTFLGLQPAVAWAIRFSLIIAYALFTAYWVFRGWLVYREHYREADWTPRTTSSITSAATGGVSSDSSC